MKWRKKAAKPSGDRETAVKMINKA